MRLIDADALIKNICTEQCGKRREDCDAGCEYVSFVDNAPTAEATPKKPYESKRKANCPFCKCRPSKWFWVDTGEYNIRCEFCISHGREDIQSGWQRTEMGAIRAWNRMALDYKAGDRDD